ncbi:hypothetical protein Tco_0631517 [Tanacetum coccineum]
MHERPSAYLPETDGQSESEPSKISRNMHRPDQAKEARRHRFDKRATPDWKRKPMELKLETELCYKVSPGNGVVRL